MLLTSFRERDIFIHFIILLLRLLFRSLYSSVLFSTGVFSFQAVTEYHSQKMSEVNQVIRELWSTIYKGIAIPLPF